MLEAGDLIFQLQLATLQLSQFQVIGRWVREGFCQFLLERPVHLFEIRKICCGHVERSPFGWSPTRKVCHVNCGKSIATLCAPQQIHSILTIAFTACLETDARSGDNF
jgi:hypothetical protein